MLCIRAGLSSARPHLGVVGKDLRQFVNRRGLSNRGNDARLLPSPVCGERHAPGDRVAGPGNHLVDRQGHIVLLLDLARDEP